MKDTSVYRRGQVWFINDDIVTKGSIQCRSRPYLVVSNDLCNMNSTVIHMAPITSQEKKPQATHVIYSDSKYEKSTILLEQIIPKSVPHISKYAKYMYTLSSEIMEKVDRAILVQFNLLQYKEDSPEVSYISTKDYQETLEEIATTTREEKHLTQIDKFNARFMKYENMNHIQKEVPIDRTKGGRIRWSPELKKQFLMDSGLMHIDDILDKYQMKLSTYRTTLSKYKKDEDTNISDS